MGIIYILSTLILLISFILIKKSEKEINIISFVCISIIALFCYNAIIAYILTLFSIKTKLWILIVINLIISLIFGVKIYRKKQIQKYSFNKIDIVYISLIGLVVLIISYINFGIPFNIKYETSDPSVHYLTSVKFAESETLLRSAPRDKIYGYGRNLTSRKLVSYVNSGLLMRLLCEELDPIECYNIFVIFGIIILFLIGTTLYSTFTNLAKKKEHRLWAFIISVICMLGYPLNSFLFGFEYMSMGLLIICGILNLVYYYEEQILDIKYFTLILVLLNYGLFASYYMFVPFVYSALGIYFCMKSYVTTNKMISKEVVKLWLLTLVLPFALGFIYHIEPKIYSELMINIKKSPYLYLLLTIGIIYLVKEICSKVQKIKTIHRDRLNTKNKLSRKKIITIILIISIILLSVFYSINNTKLLENALGILTKSFGAEGYIYINLYSNMLLLLPLTIYLLYRNTKKDYFIKLLLIFSILFIEILFVAYINGKVSIYYLSKNYFALWIILFYCNYRALILLSEKKKILPRILIGIYTILMIICTAFSDVKMIDDALTNEEENVFSVMEIFGANKTLLIKEKEKLDQDEIDILMYARKNLNYKSKIEVVSEGIQYYWSYALLRYVNYEPILDTVTAGQRKLNLKSYYLYNKINRVDYMIYFNRSYRYNQLKDRLFKNAEIIYENEAGGILKYNRKRK